MTREMSVYNTNNSFCKKCKLYLRAKNPCIIGRGDLNSKILILGECPGKTEDEQGQVFVGKSGKFLQFYINNIGLDCYISNAVLCRPTDANGKNKTPTPTEIESCKAFTIDLIRTMKPKVVLTVGNIALQQLLKLNLNIETARGKVFYHPELNTYVIPTYHPAYILRTNDKRHRDEFISDLSLAREYSLKPPPRKIESSSRSLQDPFDISEYFDLVLNSTSVAIDLETTSTDWKTGRITDISVCCEIGKGIHIDWKYIADNPKLCSKLKDILASDKIEKVFHNADFDIKFLRSVGLKVSDPIFDTMLAYHTLTMSYEGGKAISLYKLKTMTWFLTQEGGYESILDEFGGIVGVQSGNTEESTKAKKPTLKERRSLFDEQELAKVTNLDLELNKRLLESSQYILSTKKEKFNTFNVKPKEFYAAMDANVTYRIYKYLKVRIDESYSYPFYTIIMPLCRTLIRLHENGIMIDIPYIDKLIAENNTKAEKVKSDFLKKAGYEFNINSVDQLREYIFGHLKLQVNPKMVTATIKKPSTDEEALIYYSKQNPILKKILDYRGILKQTSTYLEGYKKVADEFSRVYPEYFQLGTATGRISAKNPNLQNLPRENRIRNIIIPKPGCKLVISDLCLAKGSLVVTNRGSIPIETVSIGDEVLQEDGSFRKVLNVFYRGKKEIVKIETELGYTVFSTKNHRFRVINKNGEYVWKKIGSLEKEDYIAIQPHVLSITEKTLFPEIEYKHSNNKKINKIPKYITEDLCELMGYLCGDGSFTGSSLRWVVCDKDEDVDKYIVSLFKKIFNEDISKFSRYRGVIERMFNSKPLIKALIDLGLSKENVPEFLFKSDQTLIAAWLRGFFEADGSVGDRISCSSSRNSLIKSIQKLLLSVGIVSNIWEYSYKKDSKWLQANSLSIKSFWTNIFLDTIGFIGKRKKDKLLSLVAITKINPKYSRYPNLALKSKKYTSIDELKNTRNRGGFVSVKKAQELRKKYPDIYDDLGLKNIAEWGQLYLKAKISEVSEKMDTYDIEVEDTHSFITNGFISHNSQVELRILAMIAEDQNMIYAFTSGHDFHTYTACVMFDVPLDKFDKENKEHAEKRSAAKSVNFGVAYGMRPESLAYQLNIPIDRAVAFMRRFFGTYPKVAQWIENIKAFARANGYVETIYGRRRYLPNIFSSDPYVREGAERQAINSPIQGSAGDVCFLGMIRFQEWLDANNRNAKIVGTVHDSILVETPEDEVVEISKILSSIMTKDIPRITIELKSDIEILDKWQK